MGTILQQQVLNVHCAYRENKAGPPNKPVTAWSGCGGRRPGKVSHVANSLHVLEIRHTDRERRHNRTDGLVSDGGLPGDPSI